MSQSDNSPTMDHDGWQDDEQRAAGVFPNGRPGDSYYSLYEVGDPANEVAVVAAQTPRDALALYSISEGFADPRAFIGTDEDFFWTLPDGTVGMVFTNTEIFARVQG